MKASEGKVGRVFLVNLEEGDNPAEALEQFAADNGIHAAQVVMLGGTEGAVGVLTPDENGKAGLKLAGGVDANGFHGAQAVVQELLGITFRRVRDAAGHEMYFKAPATKTRVMEKAAPAPEESGPGTTPVYLFNAEFN